jgi:hypothetical protein
VNRLGARSPPHFRGKGEESERHENQSSAELFHFLTLLFCFYNNMPSMTASNLRVGPRVRGVVVFGGERPFSLDDKASHLTRQATRSTHQPSRSPDWTSHSTRQANHSTHWTSHSTR